MRFLLALSSVSDLSGKSVVVAIHHVGNGWLSAVCRCELLSCQGRPPVHHGHTPDPASRGRPVPPAPRGHEPGRRGKCVSLTRVRVFPRAWVCRRDVAGLRALLVTRWPLAGAGNACSERVHSPTNESGSLPAGLLQASACPDGCLPGPGLWAVALHSVSSSGTPRSQEPPCEELACRWELRHPGAPRDRRWGMCPAFSVFAEPPSYVVVKGSSIY